MFAGMSGSSSAASSVLDGLIPSLIGASDIDTLVAAGCKLLRSVLRAPCVLDRVSCDCD